MAIEITAKIICDGCGKEILGEPEHRSTRANFPVWDCKMQAEEQKWVTVNRGRFHVQEHYCPRCADKPAKPIPRKRREVRR